MTGNQLGQHPFSHSRLLWRNVSIVVLENHLFLRFECYGWPRSTWEISCGRFQCQIEIKSFGVEYSRWNIRLLYPFKDIHISIWIGRLCLIDFCFALLGLVLDIGRSMRDRLNVTAGAGCPFLVANLNGNDFRCETMVHRSFKKVRKRERWCRERKAPNGNWNIIEGHRERCQILRARLSGQHQLGKTIFLQGRGPKVSRARVDRSYRPSKTAVKSLRAFFLSFLYFFFYVLTYDFLSTQRERVKKTIIKKVWVEKSKAVVS